MNSGNRINKAISFIVAFVMVFTMMPCVGGLVYGAELECDCDHDHDCGHSHAELPTGGIFQPQFDVEEAPVIPEEEIEEATENGEFFAFAEENAGPRVRKSLRSTAKSGAKSGSVSAAEKLANTIYDSPEDAAADVRQALVEGYESGASGVELKVLIDLDYWDDTDYSQSMAWNEFCNSGDWYSYNADGLRVLSKAMAYTGKAREGDYLAFRFSGGSVGFGIPNHGYYAPDGSGREYMEWRHTISQFTTGTQEQYVDARIDEILEDLELEGKSELEKIRSIYGWVATEVDYDLENLNNNSHYLKYTAYAALKDGKSVCQGYATLLYRIMNEAGIPCRVVHGDNHAWNAVKVGSRWYYVDPTWDIGYDEINWKYFLKGRNDMADHTLENAPAYNFSHDPNDPEYVDYRFADSVWYDRYPVPNGRYYQDSTDPDCTHTWNDGVVIQQKKCTQPELTEKTCTGCGATDVEITKEGTPHVGRSDTFTDVDATCTQAGGFRALCGNCNEYYFLENSNLKPALGHDWGTYQPLPASDPDHEKKHVKVCSRDASHVSKQRHSWDDGVVTTEPAETREGVRTFTCSGCGMIRTETIPAIEHTHSWGDPSYSWNGDNSRATAIRFCMQNAGHNETETVDVTETVTEATCTANGEKKFTAAFTNPAFAAQTKTVTIPATGHRWNEGVITTKPTQTQEGVEIFTCSGCGMIRVETLPTVAGTSTAKVMGAYQNKKKVANPLKIKGKTAAVKYSKLKKKNQILAVTKVIRFTKKGKGKVTYKLITAKKGKKNYKKKFKINTKNGRITVVKGLKKGTYKLKIQVKAAGNKTYKAGSKTVVVSIKVK